MKRKFLVIVLFVGFMVMSVSEAIAIEKQSSNSLKITKIKVLLLQQKVLERTILPNILILIDTIGADSNMVLKIFGDIPIAKPGTRD